MLFTTTQHAFMLTENILDPDGTIVASKRFPDEDPGTPDSFAGEYYFYNYDIRGSVTSIIAPHDIELPGDVTLQGGGPVAGYEYDEYGNLEENETQGFLNETTYTGSVTDKSTGLQYMSARYYDAENGRFLTQDTYTGNPYDPWTQHLYSYCGNNPVSMVDTTGHWPFNIGEIIDNAKKVINRILKTLLDIPIKPRIGGTKDEEVRSKQYSQGYKKIQWNKNWIGYTKLYRKDKVMVFLRQEKEGENHDRKTSEENLQRRTEKAIGRAV